MISLHTNNRQFHILLIILGLLVSFSTEAFASGVEFGQFRFVFNGVAALATIGGIISIWLGYKLFTKGIDKKRGELKAKVKFVEIFFTGIGPGLFFMAFGAIVLMVALIIFGVAGLVK